MLEIDGVESSLAGVRSIEIDSVAIARPRRVRMHVVAMIAFFGPHAGEDTIFAGFNAVEQ